jgi:hypothetical protein
LRGVLGVGLVLVGGLLIIGALGADTSRNDKPTVAGLVASLVIGLGLMVGGGVLLYRLRRTRKTAEVPDTPAGIAPHSS